MLLVSILPIGLFAAGLLYLHWQAQERERERSQIQLVRLLAAAADYGLDSTVERLSILGRLWGSGSLSDEQIHAHAKEALRVNADWSDIRGFRADGRGVFRAGAPFAMGLAPAEPLDIWPALVTEHKSVVSDVFKSAADGAYAVAIGVPVLRDGAVTEVLIATLDLRWYDQLVTRQGLPVGGVAGLFDRHFKFVARSSQGNERRGSDPSDAVVADMKRAPEGIGKYTNLNGIVVYTAWAFTRHGWGVGIATPAAPIDDPFWHHLLAFGWLWAAVMALGIVYAVSKARLITASLQSLARQARQVAAGQRIADIPASRVTEIDRALAALEEASVLLQSTTEQRDRSLETEREARTAAEAASRAKDEFLAMLGHELRNPLAAISNAAAILGLEGRTQRQLDFAAELIGRQSQHLKRLIDDLLDVGRVITGKIILTRAPLDLAASVRYVATTLQTAGRLADRRLDLDLAPAWLHGDHTRVEQIVDNLLVNAATYTAPGGRIRIQVSRESGETVLRVSDDGRGIAPENLPRVFNLFFQVDSAVDRTTGGLGIGLTLVQRLARLHGGDVKVESEGLGRGTSFTVRFPAIAALEPTASAPAPDRAAAGETILVVEDHADGRESLCLALRLQGHRVLAAADGVAALDLLQRERAMIAVLDIGLPGMDGYQLAGRLREKFGRAMVLIALTGYGLDTDAQRAMEAGFDRHLTKPVDVQKLLQAIEIAGRSRGRAVALD